jgi:hypothetical protein
LEVFEDELPILVEVARKVGKILERRVRRQVSSGKGITIHDGDVNQH